MSLNLFTIAASAPFLPSLATKILDGTLLSGWPREGPFWLSDVTIVLPTRRAKLTLAKAFLERGEILLPDIRTFGGEPADEEPFLPPHDLPPLPQAVSPLERKLVLAQLVDAWARTPGGREVLASPPHAAEIIGLSGSLGELIDDLAVEGVSYETLRALPPAELAANWQKTLQFLDIALKYWPEELQRRDREDEVKLRNQRLRRQADAATLIFGERPVIAAGSTGSIPATADLLAALAKLPRGAIVLPGLDNSLSSAAHAALLDDASGAHGHPQYGLAKLLRHLKTTPSVVIELADPPSARTLVLREALAPAAATADWSETRLRLAQEIPLAAEGLSIIAARTADEEARAIALAARDALERGESVGIISPDQTLARRIAAELQRFDVVVDDPAGTPLFQSPAGRLLRQILAVAVDAFAPVDLIALLRNRATTLGHPRADIARLTDRFELSLLRGQRPRSGLDGLRRALSENLEGTNPHAPRLTPSDGAEIAVLFDSLQGALEPLLLLIAKDQLRAASFAQALHRAFATIAGAPDDLPGASEIAEWVAELAARPEDGPSFAAANLDGVLSALMQGFTVTNVEHRRDDIFIWGQLEARLQNPDLMILAGLNEDLWPQPADPGPWLSRGMRMAAGLEPPERRQGQAAHDFEMALGNRRAIIAFAERLGTAPALPSRLVQRLEAFLGPEIAGEMRGRGQRWIAEARRLDAVAGLPRAAQRPLPKPPAKFRPRQLSVTEVETLFRSPYDLYAKHVLRLRRLAPLGEAPDARERGSMIHEVFSRFIEDGHAFDAPDALEKLETLAAESFAGLDAIGERRDIWLRRFSLAAQRFIDFERERQARIASRHAEISGRWVFPDLDNFTLTGRADRVDALRDGGLEIIDFKTGAIPSKTEMQDFDAPQLLLEAAMARAGVLKGIAPAEVSALTYIKIGLGPEAFVPTAFRPREGLSLKAPADEISRRLRRHVDEFLIGDQHPMAARILPAGRSYRGDYDHLARTDEWTLVEGDESE